MIDSGNMQTFFKFAESLRDLQRQAAQQYQPVVERCRSKQQFADRRLCALFFLPANNEY